MKLRLIYGLISILSGLSAAPLLAYEQTDLDWSNAKNLTLNSSNLQTILGLDADSRVRETTRFKLSPQEYLIKYTQEYKGTPIFSTHVTVKYNSQGGVKEVSGAVISNLEEDISGIKEADFIAPDVALNETIAKHHKNSKDFQKFITNQQIKRWVYLHEDKSAQYVYIVSWVYERNNQASRPYKIIDATTLDEVDSWEGLTYQQNANGPGGNAKTGKYTYGTDLGPIVVDDSCAMSTATVDTWDMRNAQQGGSLFRFVCPTNTYKLTNGAFSPLNDAHYMGSAVYNMYTTWYNQPPINLKLKNRVHYGFNYENAFWDGQQMTFGDGGQSMYPLMSFDVMGHEVSHGFTEQHSGLVYKGQSGGMNEAFSDMAGEATENFAKKTNDFLIGAEIMKRGQALRFMADPKKDGISIDNAKDYTDQMDVHHTSGVYNKAFYTLATSANWDIRKAFEVFMIANATYWDSKATFDTAADGVCKAAKDKNYDTAAVTNAFVTVGVKGCPGGGPGPGPDPVPVPSDNEIKNGVPKLGLTARTGSDLWFFLKVPKTSTIAQFVISGGMGGLGDADLYVKRGALPTQVTFDCRPYLQGSDEICTMKNDGDNTYYIVVRAFETFSGVTLVGYSQ